MTATECTQRTIAFSPPDITDAEVEAGACALKSGWITTGPRTKELEERLRDAYSCAGVACLSSATAALECALRVMGIGPGDEVITSAYTYTASASAIVHVGATPVLCDCAKDAFQIDIDAIPSLITPKTKAVIPVDVGGRMVDYDRLLEAVESKSDLFRPATPLQEAFGRVMVLADSAHALGASYKGRPCGSVADFTASSFHAVKNLTTGEGGALAWRKCGLDDGEIYHQLMLQSLHGQSKDALTKCKAGSWEYDIVFPGYKCNMTDIQAALGLAQFERYPALLARRRKMIEHYAERLEGNGVSIMQHYADDFASSGHLMLTRIEGADGEMRNRAICRMADMGVSCNVHYKPLPLFTAYRNMGFDPGDFPNSCAQFENELTLPLHTLLSDEDIDYVCDCYLAALGECR